MISTEELLEQAAHDGTFESGDWPRVLEDVLLRLDSIVESEFPTPTLPPSQPPPPRLGSPISTLDEHTSSQDSTTSNKENTPVAKSSTPRPPVPSFTQSPSATQRSTATTDGASNTSSTYPPDLLSLHQSIRTTLKTTFSRYPPYSVQRLAELILYPKKHYRFLPPYLNALDRTVSVSSNISVFPLPQASLPNTGLLNGSSMPNQSSAANALGSDESLGGALLTPIPWLSPVRDVQAQRVAAANNDRELQRESTEIVDGPNGVGRIETVSVVNGVMTTVYSHAPLPSQPAPSPTSTAVQPPVAHSTEQTLRAEGAVTQGELLRQEQEAGVVPVSPRRLRMSEEEMRIMDADEQEEDEKPHARGPEEIGMEDTGPQEKPTGAPLNMEHAAGRSRRESSVEREMSPEEVRSAASREEVMKDTGAEDEKEDKKAEMEFNNSDEDMVIVDAADAVPEDRTETSKPSPAS